MEDQFIESCGMMNKLTLTEVCEKKGTKCETAKNTSCVNCNICPFPPEIWERIFEYVFDVKDLKSISRVCQIFNAIIKDKLWNTPKIKHCISTEDFLNLKHLPIKNLDMCHIGILKYDVEYDPDIDGATIWIDAITQFTQLTSLILGSYLYPSYLDIGKLSALKNLKSLTFGSLYIGLSKGISELIHLPLECFLIKHVEYPIDDDSDIELISEAVGQMSMLKKLQILTTDKGCIYLSKLSQLEVLIVDYSYLTMVGCKRLSALELLRKVEFNQCCYPDDNMDELIDFLKEVNPKLHVDVAPLDDYYYFLFDFNKGNNHHLVYDDD